MALARNCTDLCIPDPCASTKIEYKNLHFLISRSPSPSELGIEKYIDELKFHNVKVLVRVCQPRYATDKLTKSGITVVDMEYPDGFAPSNDVIEAWFKLIRDRFVGSHVGECVAIHCVTGLGRSALLIALTLIEMGMKNEDVVDLIRTQRRGAFNMKQYSFLMKFKPKSRLVVKTKTKSIIASKLRRLSTIVYN